VGFSTPVYKLLLVSMPTADVGKHTKITTGQLDFTNRTYAAFPYQLFGRFWDLGEPEIS